MEQDARSEEVRRAERDGKCVLVADDDASIRSLLNEFLSGEGLTVAQVVSGQELVANIKTIRPDVVLMDMRMPGMDGIAVLREMQLQNNNVPFIMMTAYGSSSLAIQATQLGAYDYITKPFDLDEVLLTIDRLIERQRLTSELQSLRAQVDNPRDRIIGSSIAMQTIYKMIGRVAGTDATVLITGESGTGKELVADTIHVNSTYRHGQLVKVNCAAMPETLLESELFGHEKGSFTGAVNTYKGRFERAHKGTIFLDEIGEMSLNIQRKFLRVLQEREIERVGGSVTIPVDARVIAATNRRLEDEVANGRFREDLYYRLNVVIIDVPPLRERKEDIPLLVEHFLNKHRYTEESTPARISAEAMQVLQGYGWPGNVRELENTIRRAVVLAQGEVITSHQIVFSGRTERARMIDIASRVRERHSLRNIVGEVEKLTIMESLEQVNGDRNRAAANLGLELPQLYTLMRDYGLGD